MHPALYREIQELLWVKDGFPEMERETIDQLLYIGVGDIANLEGVLELVWVQDGITETEYDAIYWLRALGYEDKEAAAAIIAMPWLQDGITETEYDVVAQFHSLAYDGNKAAAAIIAMPWVQDGITETEYDAIYWLRALGYEDKGAAAAIIAMPFLDTIEADDVLAIRGMHSLANDGLLSALIDHPTLQTGIADAQTTLVTATATLQDAEEISRMLSPGHAAIETLSAGTELTPNLKISIVRTGTQPQPWTMEGVRDAVEFAERTMQLPLPTSHVIVVLNDKAVPGGYAGANHGYAIGYLPEYELGQDNYDRYKFQSGLLHEVAHYYWRGNETGLTKAWPIQSNICTAPKPK